MDKQIKVVIIGESGNMGACLKDFFNSQSEYLLAPTPYISRKNSSSIENVNKWLNKIDKELIVIDFSHTTISQILLKFAIKNPLKLVIGTSDIPADLLEKVDETKCSTLFYAVNFSQGVMGIVQMLNAMKNSCYEDFDIAILDEHGKHKIERPSATAKFFERLCKHNWPNACVDVASLRYGDGVSEHMVNLVSGNEDISISLKIKSRTAFLLNIDKAVQFIIKADPGVYGLNHLLRG